MGRLPVLSGREVIRGLKSVGFVVVGHKGSHVRLKGTVDGAVRVVIVPDHRELTPGTRASVIRQSGLGRQRFVALFER